MAYHRFPTSPVAPFGDKVPEASLRRRGKRFVQAARQSVADKELNPWSQPYVISLNHADRCSEQHILCEVGEGRVLNMTDDALSPLSVFTPSLLDLHQPRRSSGSWPYRASFYRIHGVRES